MTLPFPAPFDRHFNAAVLHLAARCWPRGYDVRAEGAPDNLADLSRMVRETGRLVVWSGGSDDTIFGDPEVNYAFRAWHDWHHFTGQYDFTPDGEAETARAQVRQLRDYYGDTETVEAWSLLVYCEVVGQAQYHARHGEFPPNQRAFATQWLAWRGLVCPPRLGLAVA